MELPPLLNLERRVVCAAIRHAETKDIILGPRHCDTCMWQQIRNYKLKTVEWEQAEQGFINTWGEFLTRHEAWEVAKFNYQIIKRVGNDGPEGAGLFSENLY